MSTSLSLSNVLFNVLLISRVSNNEKKLEAVRSGVRAISVSGKMEIMDVSSHESTGSGVFLPFFVPAVVFLSVFPFPPTAVFFMSHCFPLCWDCLSLSVSLLHPILFAVFCLLPSPHQPLTSPLCARIHSRCLFPLQTLVAFAARLAADLVMSTPPKPTGALRFLLPFVFCSDSPPNGILGSHWTAGRGVHPQSCGVAEVSSVWPNYGASFAFCQRKQKTSRKMIPLDLEWNCS